MTRLSQRHKEILSLMRKGLSHEEIANTLGIGLSTTKNHLTKIYKFLKVSGKYKLLTTDRGTLDRVCSVSSSSSL